jgi:hypothetical protein
LTTQTVESIVRADRPISLDPNDPSTPALADIARGDFVMFELGVTTRLQLGEAIQTGSLKRTITGASVVRLTCLDLDGSLLRHRLLRRSSDGRFYARMVLDGLVFHLVSVDKAPRRVVLEFEEQAYNAMRRHDTPLAMSRNAGTRAEFIKQMCDEAHVRLISPELKVKQHIADPPPDLTPPENVRDDPISLADKDRNREPGLPDHAKLTFKGKTASNAQLTQTSLALSEARAISAGPLATLALMCAAIGESNVGDEPGTFTSGAYRGVFQASPKAIDPRDTTSQAHYFLVGGKGFQSGGAIKLAKDNPGMKPGEIALRVEGSLSNFGSLPAGRRLLRQAQDRGRPRDRRIQRCQRRLVVERRRRPRQRAQ